MEGGDLPAVCGQGSRRRDRRRGRKKKLRAYLEWECDELKRITCCLTADDELLEHEPHIFSCETCPVLKERQGLSESNARAFEVFDLLARRVVVDFRLAPLV